jgi:hypothetical protein
VVRKNLGMVLQVGGKNTTLLNRVNAFNLSIIEILSTSFLKQPFHPLTKPLRLRLETTLHGVALIENTTKGVC